MKRLTFRLICFVLLLGQLSFNNFAQTQPDSISRLEQGKPIEHELKGGDSHFYSIRLEKGQFAGIVVDQRGIDVVVLVFAPDGKQLGEVDSPNGDKGPEPVSVFAKTTGDYRVEVRSLEKNAPFGRYEIKVTELRAGTEQDRINDLAARLAGAKSKEDATALLATENELVTPALGQAVYKQGVSLLNARNFPQSLFVFELMLKLGEQLNDKKVLVGAHSGLGTVYEVFGNFDVALEHHLKSVALLEQMNDKPRLAQSYANAGHALRFKGDYQRALEYYQKSAALFQETDNKFELISELNDVALSYNALGNQQAAVETFEKSLAVFEAFEHNRLKLHTLDLLGMTYITQGRYQKAMESFQAALKLTEETKWLSRSIDIHSHIGVVYFKQGYNIQALESYQKASNLAETANNQQKYATASIQIADVLFSQGNRTQSAEFYQRAFNLLETTNAGGISYGILNNKAAMAYALNRLGEIQAGQGDFKSALEYYQKSLKLLESIPADSFPDVMVFLLNNMGDLHRMQKNYADALTYYQKGLAISEKVESESATANSLTNISNVFYLQGDHNQALKAAIRAAEIGDRIGDRAVLWTAQTTTGKVYRSLNNPEQARQFFTDAIKNIESLRLNVGGNQARASYFAQVQEPFEQYVELLMELHAKRPAEGYNVVAFEISERQRARSLLESLSEARADIRQGVDTNLLQRERDIRGQLNAKAENQMRLFSDTNARPTTPLSEKEREGRAEVLKKEIIRLTTEYQNIEAQIKQSSPRYAALTQPEPLNLREIQEQVLDRDTVLLEYALGEKRSYLWMVTKDSIKSFELPPRAELELSARRIYTLLSDGKQVFDEKAQAEYQTQAARLSQILLGAVAAQIKNKRIVIVADGALQYLPFGALPASTAKNKRQPLIVENEIIRLPSASTLAALRREANSRRQATKNVAVFADPVFDTADERLAAVKTSKPPSDETSKPDFVNSQMLLQRAFNLRGESREPLQISRLPFSRREAEAILAFYPSSSSLKALDFQANRETALSTEMSQYRIVHFATHGLLNSEYPELSGIVLSLVNEQGQPIDGFLRLNEIYNLDLSADLVVLSACQTALGKEIKGEGLIGLTRGFMYAGSPRVVASLWKVDDVATAELMKLFYQKMLTEKMRPAAALRAAKIEMWKQKRWNAPFYWAAFEIQGEWR